jgi:hypothetical protein
MASQVKEILAEERFTTGKNKNWAPQLGHRVNELDPLNQRELIG